MVSAERCYTVNDCKLVSCAAGSNIICERGECTCSSVQTSELFLFSPFFLSFSVSLSFSLNTAFNIRKTCPCNVYTLEPHFYTTKMGYAGVYLFFLVLLQNIDCGYSLEPPRRGGSNVYPQFMF